MVATTDQKARLLDLTTGLLEMVRDGKRECNEVCDVLQVIKDNPNFAQKLFPSPKSLKFQLRDWQSFYLKFFNLKKDFTNLPIPKEKKDFDFLLILARGLTPNQIYGVMNVYFRCWKYTDDLDATISDRTSQNGDYAIWLRNRQEADEELKNLSANQLKEKGISGITLEERLVLELFYFWKNQKHRDFQNITLCSGSRDLDDDVPFVHWDGCCGGVGVNWTSPDNRSEGRRCRLVVS